MKLVTIERIKELHNKVIHGPQDLEAFTEEEYLLESKKIGKLNNAALDLVCQKCFPLSVVAPVPKGGWSRIRQPNF